MVVADNVIGEEPKNFKLAMKSKHKSKWIAIMEEEIASLKKNNIWILVRKLVDKKLVGCKWIYKVNDGISDDGISGDEPARYKERLVAKGFTQRE